MSFSRGSVIFAGGHFGYVCSESEIERNRKNKQELYGGIIYQLYARYVKQGGEQQVNISWQTRTEIETYINNQKETIRDNILLNDEEYYCIFDGCIIEILRLLNADSYARFTHTDKYKQLEEIMKNGIHP